jgi:tRNA A37 threonylcarbamoyladenosine dehydratase
MTEDRFARIERLVGPEGIRRLAEAHVAVVGLGAVGSYAVEALARAGVGRLRLVDHDEVRPTNLNRQIHALHSTLGRPKAEVLRDRVLDIAPGCRVEALRLFVHVESLDRVLEGPPDLVIDAIDAVGPKVELLAAAVGRGIRVISSMGAALRTDPTCVRIGPLARCERCPLARQIRKRLRQRGVWVDFPCVYSVEAVAGRLAESVGEPEEDTEEVPRGRKRRVLGSLPTLPGIFGLAAANEALRILLGDAWPG